MAPVVRRTGVALRRKSVRPHSLRRNAVRAIAASVTVVVLSSPMILTSASAAAPQASNVYRVAGNEFIAPGGEQFVPYGFVLYCLAMKSLSCEHPTRHDPNTDIDRIRAAASFWHSNTVRIQVAPEHLLSSKPFNGAYLKVLDREVSLANRLHMVAIITMQTEQFKGPPLPTAQAINFWTVLARHYERNSMVFFDLYNEPRLKPTQGERWMWNLWRNGGSATVKGVTQDFVGMQRLVNVIRRTGSQNVIIAEGNQGDHDLSLLRQYLLDGTNVGYGIEPDLTSSDQTPGEWAANWGNLSSSVPISMEAFQDWPSTSVCNPNSPQLLPELLNYLAQKHLGLIAWSLNGGHLIVGANLTRPTTFNGVSSYLCGSTSAGGRPQRHHHHHHHHHHRSRHRNQAGRKVSSHTPESAGADVGPGADILGFFRSQSTPAPPPSPVVNLNRNTGSRATNWETALGALLITTALSLAAYIGLIRWRKRN